MTQIVSSSAVKLQIAMTLLMAPSQPSHFLEKQDQAAFNIRKQYDINVSSSIGCGALGRKKAAIVVH
ncbi:hypothetical protein E2C01_080166 [Portunus trituberculatus]|uniref:Uncharacterized protein n=1 Tax=Portunus trituberculatus TaxID=210409 RepID=A0A5B7IYU6_PORTR|nr:hypothetical protein [Portunus trituberculatus]